MNLVNSGKLLVNVASFENQVEVLFDAENFINLLNKKGFVIIRDEILNKETFMSEEELLLSSFFRLVVMRRDF